MMKYLFVIALFLLSQVVTAQGEPDEYLHARAKMLNNEFGSALELLDQAAKDNPRDISILYNRGICHFELNQYEEALADFLKVNKLRSGKSNYMLARTEARLNHQDEAIKYLRANLSSSYKVKERDILMQDDFSRLSTTAEWKALWNEKEWYRSYEKSLREAELLIKNEEYPDAINILNDLNDNRYMRSEVNQELARAYLNTGNLKAAIDAADIAVSSDSRNLEVLKLRIQINLQQEDFDDANRDCETLLRVAPDEFEYYVLSAEVLSKLGSFDRAIQKIGIYQKIYPESAEAYNTLGSIHFQNGKYLNALSAFNHCIKLDASNPVYFFNRGRTYFETKTYKYASNDLSMALDLDPENEDIWFYKGRVNEALGNISDACSAYKKAYRLGKYEAQEYVYRLCGN